MAPITAELRLRVTSREDAQALSAWLSTILGDVVRLYAPTAGRGPGVWFVRGVVACDPAALVEALVRSTGEIVFVPGPPADTERTARLNRLAGLSRPEARPDDGGVDRRELHKRLQEDKERT